MIDSLQTVLAARDPLLLLRHLVGREGEKTGKRHAKMRAKEQARIRREREQGRSTSLKDATKSLKAPSSIEDPPASRQMVGALPGLLDPRNEMLQKAAVVGKGREALRNATPNAMIRSPKQGNRSSQRDAPRAIQSDWKEPELEQLASPEIEAGTSYRDREAIMRNFRKKKTKAFRSWIRRRNEERKKGHRIERLGSYDVSRSEDFGRYLL